jgi:hypothetical protein
MAAAGAADINVDPLRLEAISLQAFGAFSANERIPIGGRNLVIYGENGAGKSSIYRALRDLFARVPSSQSLAKAKHVHDLDDDLVPAVTVEFSKGAAVEWTLAKHPGLPMADPRIAQARTRSAFLDYQPMPCTAMRRQTFSSCRLICCWRILLIPPTARPSMNAGAPLKRPNRGGTRQAGVICPPLKLPVPSLMRRLMLLSRC